MGQFMADYGFIAWIVIGLLAGLIAKAIMPGKDPGGLIVTILLGIAGAVLAGFLGQMLGWYDQGEGAGFIAAIVGALILLAIYRMVAGRRRIT
ncbi:MAG TPA: GlsB/YeaQ/YmgE family stress response membrane protein [Allosphingosinicella sp.]|jgi:uncharacterized membrane protein YeaQ/YmgE (transglycosylase-associated protein family)